MKRRIATAALLGMIGLAAGPALSAENNFDRVYTGKRVLTKGSAQTCPTEGTEGDVSVTIQGDALMLTGSMRHNFLMGFDPHPDGSFSQIVSGGGGGFMLDGRVVGDAIEADIADRDCTYHWHLKRSQ
jgi:hypothetical protein